MNDIYANFISAQLGVAVWQVVNCVELLQDSATVPFISRYRKERTGGLDEVQIGQVKHWWQYFAELDKRKEAVLKSIAEQGALTPELEDKIKGQTDLCCLEDLYLPFRPKRKTRASVAVSLGLAPLAEAIYDFKSDAPYALAAKYLTDEVPDVDAAIAGARDIIAEKVSENAEVRQSLRESYLKWGVVASRQSREGAAKSEESDKYRNYFDHREPLSRIASHRLLAILRGGNEGMLSIKIEVDADRTIDRITRIVTKGRRFPTKEVRDIMEDAIADGYKRLLHPSIEKEALRQAKEKADAESIKVFGENLRQLLLAPPVGQKRTMAIDPGFRTGCKVVCLDAQGNLLHNDTIYPHPPVSEKIMAMKKISNMVQAYKIEVIAIGSGTAGRETENFIKKVGLPQGVRVYSVSEDGASVYSASSVAREEFPQYDVTVRGAVSIGRRLMDPLSELVKIDPKSIGVGQYQHDVDQTLLKEQLDMIVESCVSSVGVNLNTAGVYLLQYVSGIGPALASAIVEHRNANGPFTSREQLLGVKRLGQKAFQQCAGFLRISGAENPLDNSAVHPERYALVKQMAGDKGIELHSLIGDESLCDSIDLSRYAHGDVGLPTLQDIIKELKKPGRDPREAIKVFEFDDKIRTIEDVQRGMILPGIVTNITDFGAFVDIGIKQNGLIHVSNMARTRVDTPHKILKIQQQIEVKVIDVDLNRGRIALSLILD
ncbi:MAG: RNA-binding transcriptional accessory protein [Bacteroidales bacterium]|nr:RNA-binding transcriptional accessory protein [Bacteroidales bacterium]